MHGYVYREKELGIYPFTFTRNTSLQTLLSLHMVSILYLYTTEIYVILLYCSRCFSRIHLCTYMSIAFVTKPRERRTDSKYIPVRNLSHPGKIRIFFCQGRNNKLVRPFHTVPKKRERTSQVRSVFYRFVLPSHTVNEDEPLSSALPTYKHKINSHIHTKDSHGQCTIKSQPFIRVAMI